MHTEASVKKLSYRDLQKYAVILEKETGTDIQRNKSKAELLKDVLALMPKKPRPFSLPKAPPVPEKPVSKPVPPVVVATKPTKPKWSKADIEKEILKRAINRKVTAILNARKEVLDELGMTDKEYNNL